jgi:hypothetical protein
LSKILKWCVMKDKEIKEFIEKGYILTKVIFEMAGNPKEYVEETFKKYIQFVKQDPEYIFMNEYMAPCEERDDKVWSTFFESDILVASFEKLDALCFNMGPASVEIIEPENFSLTQKQVTYMYNDLIAKLHEVSINSKNLSGENELLKVNLNRAIRNCVILALAEPKNSDELALKVGIDKEHLQPFLETMVKEKTIIQENNKFILIK